MLAWARKFSRLSENQPKSTKNFILGFTWAKTNPRAPPSLFYSRLSENYLASTRYAEKFCINLLYQLDSKPTFHSIQKFINLHITLTLRAHNYTSTLIKSLSYYVNIYIYMISKSKLFKIKQPILIKHFI